VKNNASLRQLYRVFSHEYWYVFSSKFFRAFTLLLLLGIFLLLTIPPITANKSTAAPSPTAKTLLIADSTGMFEQADFASEPGYIITLQDGSATLDQLKTQINGGMYDDAMIICQDAQGKICLNFVTKRSLSSLPEDLLTLAAAANIRNVMARHNVPPTAITQALTAPDLIVTETSGSLMDGFLPSYIMVMLMFYSIIAYGMMIATGVAQEKSSRAMELLITSAKTHNLILGKILGIGLAALTQLAIWLAGMYIFFRINFSYWQDDAVVSGIFGMPAVTIVHMLLFYLLGFFMYAALYGAIGSLVSRTEEIQMAQLPLTLLFLIGLLATIFGMILPGPLLTVFSFIPLYTPMSMFARINTTYVPWWQITLSLALSVATVVAFAWAAVKIYRIGVLMYGKTPSVKEMLRALRDDTRY